MTDIEARALALWGPGIAAEVNLHNFAILGSAFIEMRDRHEAFKQEVSDAVEHSLNTHFISGLNRFIIPKPKPDPLVEVIKAMQAEPTTYVTSEVYANLIHKKLDDLGFEIREKGQ
jgi:hypothetical protein